MQHFPSLAAIHLLAEEARQGLHMVAQGEDQTIDGWVRYGSALNEGRKLHRGDREFGRWIEEQVLYQVGNAPRAEDQNAAMWAAADPVAFEETRGIHPRVRTVRGLHAKWKEAQHRLVEARSEEDARVMQKLRALVDHPSTDPQVRSNAQRKLDAYEERYGQVVTEAPKPKLTKEELSACIIEAALKKASRSSPVFDVLQCAILHTYGATVEELENILGAVKAQ